MIRRGHLGLRAILILYFCIGSCSSELQVHARVANGVAMAANRILPQLLEIYRTEGLRRIRQAPDRASAEHSLQELREQWRPLWGECESLPRCRGGAWEALREAHDLWAHTLERQIAGEPLNLPSVIEMGQRLQTTFCAVRAAVPAESRSQIPSIPGVQCL